MALENNQKLLTNKHAIQEYIQSLSTSNEPCTDYMFKKYVERGFPARFEDNRWLAHKDNIDEFFKTYTRVSMKNAIKDIKDE